MSFGAGMGAGMGAGIGTGMAIGIASGKKQARREISGYLESNGLTIHDRSGKPLDPETVLADATSAQECCTNRLGVKIAVLSVLLLGVVALGIVFYLHSIAS